MVAHMWPKTLLPPSLAVMIWLAKWDKMNILLCQFQVTLIINQSELNYQDIDQIFSVKKIHWCCGHNNKVIWITLIINRLTV